MAQQASASSQKVNFWEKYKYFFHHRLVEKDGRTGLVTRECYSSKQLASVEPSPLSVYEIMWFDDENPEQSKAHDILSLDRLKYPEFKKIVTDEFTVHPDLPTPPIIEHMILPLQKMNWHASKKEHSAMIAKATDESEKLRQRAKDADKAIQKLIAPTAKEVGAKPKPPKAPKAQKAAKPKASDAAGAQEKKSKTAAAAAAAGGKPPRPEKAKAAASKGKATAAAGAGVAGPSSAAGASGQAAAPSSAGKKAATAEKARKGSRSAASAEQEPSSDFETAPARKQKTAATAEAAATDKKRKKQPQQEQPAAKPQQEPANKKQKTTAATAGGGSAGAGGSNGGVKGVTGRVYPGEVVWKAGDKRLGTAAYAEGNEDIEYPVEAIVDEVEIAVSSKSGKAKKQVKVLPKWQGYELDPTGWEDKAGLKEVEAYVAWDGLTNKPAYFNAVSNAGAAEAYVKWATDLAKGSKKKKK